MMPALLLALILMLLVVSLGAADYTVWTAPSVQKVFRDDKPPPKVERYVNLTTAGNEWEAIQIVVTAGDEALEDVTVTTTVHAQTYSSDLTPPDVHPNLYLVRYVPCPSAGRDYPDPLPPLTKPFRVEAGTSQPVWLEVYTPRSVQLGFRLQCAVKPANAPPKEVWLSCRARRFALPAAVEPLTTFGLSDGFVLEQHGVAAGTPEAKALIARYYEFLLDHYVSPYYLPVDLKSPEAARYLNDPRLTSFIIPWREDEAYLRDMATYLDQHGWLGKAYLYVVDEPINRESYDAIRAAAELIHRAHPRLRLTAPFYRAPDWDASLTTFDVLTGSLDIWCPNESYFDSNARIYKQFQERQKAGEAGWWYVCCGPGGPYNNFFVQMDGFAHRLIFTQMYRLGVTGLLYWSTTYWSPGSGTKDPWTDMATVKDINPSIYGDGSLLYPGKQVGLDGPVASIRLKLIREGIEDYQYLRLLAQAHGEEAATRAARSLCTSLTEYCRDAEQLAQTREKIAREIEG
jgi:Glycoside hydrolase 123, catalytic domain